MSRPLITGADLTNVVADAQLASSMCQSRCCLRCVCNSLAIANTSQHQALGGAANCCACVLLASHGPAAQLTSNCTAWSVPASTTCPAARHGDSVCMLKLTTTMAWLAGNTAVTAKPEPLPTLNAVLRP